MRTLMMYMYTCNLRSYILFLCFRFGSSPSVTMYQMAFKKKMEHSNTVLYQVLLPVVVWFIVMCVLYSVLKVVTEGLSTPCGPGIILVL